VSWSRFTAGLLSAGVLAGASLAAPAAPTDDMSLGAPSAPVTVIEYASLGCPHCGTWSRDVFPEFKKKFIDTGRARFVLREMLTGNSAVAAAGFLTARCAPKDKYFQVVEELFAAQPRIERDGDDLPALLDVAAHAGLTNAQVRRSRRIDQRAGLGLPQRPRGARRSRGAVGQERRRQSRRRHAGV
jgi:protein-disulfide isomerase